MSRLQGQDTEELLQRTIARVKQLAPHLVWPRVAYQAKLNPYGTFYGKFIDKSSNRRVENGQAGPSTAQPGSLSPTVDQGSPAGEEQAQSQAPGSGSGGAASPTFTSVAPHQPPQQQQQSKANGDGLRPRSLTAAQQQQQQQQQRKGPRGFNIPRPNARPRPVGPSGGVIGEVEGGPSPSSSQTARSPVKIQPPLQRGITQAKKNPPADVRTQRPDLQASSPGDAAELLDGTGAGSSAGYLYPLPASESCCNLAAADEGYQPGRGQRGKVAGRVTAGLDGDDCGPGGSGEPLAGFKDEPEASAPIGAVLSGCATALRRCEAGALATSEQDASPKNPTKCEAGDADAQVTDLQEHGALDMEAASPPLPLSLTGAATRAVDGVKEEVQEDGIVRPAVPEADGPETGNAHMGLMTAVSEALEKPSNPELQPKPQPSNSDAATGHGAPCNEAGAAAAPAGLLGLSSSHQGEGHGQQPSSLTAVAGSESEMASARLGGGQERHVGSAGQSHPSPANEDGHVDVMLMEVLDGWDGSGSGDAAALPQGEVPEPEIAAATAGGASAPPQRELQSDLEPTCGDGEAAGQPPCGESWEWGGGARAAERETAAGSPGAGTIEGSAVADVAAGRAPARRASLPRQGLPSQADGQTPASVADEAVAAAEAASHRDAAAEADTADASDRVGDPGPTGQAKTGGMGATAGATAADAPVDTVTRASPSSSPCHALTSGAGSQAEVPLAVEPASAAAGEQQAMPPPQRSEQLPQQQQRAETGGQITAAVATAARTPAGLSVSRRTSNISLQTLESGELPGLDTPVGGTPSSALQPLPLQLALAAAHGAAGLSRAGRSSSLGSLLVTQSRGRGGSGRLDIGHVESGELPLTLSEVQPLAAAPPEERGGPAEQQRAERDVTHGAEAGAGGAGQADMDLGAAAAGGRSPPLEPLPRSSQDGRVRRRWGKPIADEPDGVTERTTTTEAGTAPGDGGFEGEADGMAGDADAAQVGHVVDLSRTKGPVEHHKTHGLQQQDGVPNVQERGSVGGDTCSLPALSRPESLKRRSRSPARAHPDQHPSGEADRDREARGSREPPEGTAGAGACEAASDPVAGPRRTAGGGVGGGPGQLPRPSRSRSRSRSRERIRRHSRSPRRRGSRSRSRSPVRDWRDKRDPPRTADYDRYRDRDRDYDRDRYGGRERNRDRERDRDRDRDRERDWDRERERERDRQRGDRQRERDRDTDRRGGGSAGDRHDGRYDGRGERPRDYGRPSDRARDGRPDTRTDRGASGGSASVARQSGAEQVSQSQPVSQSQNPPQQQQQLQQRQQKQEPPRRHVSAAGPAGGAGMDGQQRGPAANGVAGRRSVAEALAESESAGSVYPHKRPHRDTAAPVVAAGQPGSTSRGGSGSDMDLDDSDNEGPAQKGHQPEAAAGASAAATAAPALADNRSQQPSASTSSLAGAVVRRPGGFGFGARQHARAAAAAAAAAAVATAAATTTAGAAATTTHVGSSAHSPASIGGVSPSRTAAASGAGGGGKGATSPLRPPNASQQPKANSPGGPRSGAPPALASAASARQLGSGRRPAGSQAQPPVPQLQPQQKQPQQQQNAAALHDKAERALARLQQDRGRPGTSGTISGRQPPLPGGSATAKPGPGRGAGGGGGGAGGGAAGNGPGAVAPPKLVACDTDAASDPAGDARVGCDAPLSANMEPDLLGFTALSMIQFSCAYMVDSPRSLFNKAHIKALADEGRTLRRKADSNREANGNRWNALLLTLYVQSALKSMESAYGHEQAGQEREASMRTSLELLASASQMLAVVSHEAHRLSQQLPRPPHGAGGTAAGAAGAASRAADGGAPPATPPPAKAAAGVAGAPPATPPQPPKGAPGSPTNSMRSMGFQTPSGGGCGGSRTPQHGGGCGGTPLGPLHAAVACANCGGPAPSPELLVLEAIRLLALKLNAICRTRWLLANQDSLVNALKLHEPSPAQGGGPAAPGGAGGGGGDENGGGGGGAGGGGPSGRRTSPTAAADSASSTLEAAALTASSYTASIQQMAESVQAYAAAADAWRRAGIEARAFNQAVSAAGVEQAAVVAAARIGALGYEGGLWDLMGSVNLARKALDSITGML